MKQLSEMLAEVEPDVKGTWHKLDNYYAECILPETKNTTSLVTKEDYDKLKAIAVELAKAMESTNVHCGATTIRSWAETRRKLIKINNGALTTARKMLEEK